LFTVSHFVDEQTTNKDSFVCHKFCVTSQSYTERNVEILSAKW